MRALVTGCAGFIGSTLVARLLDLGHDVVGIDSLTDYYDVSLKRENLSTLQSEHFTLIEGDLVSMDLSQVGGVSHIFHLAGQPGVRKSWGDEFSEYIHANIAATQRLLEFARGIPGLDRFVYASSSSIYGDAERYPTVETDLPRPVSPYGATKLAGEHLCGVYAASFGLPTVALRFFTVYGPRQRPDMAFTRFLTAAANGTPIDLYGTGEQVRDFTFVDDVVEALVAAAVKPTEAGAVFNVAGGSSVSVNETLDIIRDVTGNDLTVRRLPQVAGDVKRTGGATTAIRDQLGWSPTTDVRSGLVRHWEWIRRPDVRVDP